MHSILLACMHATVSHLTAVYIEANAYVYYAHAPHSMLALKLLKA